MNILKKNKREKKKQKRQRTQNKHQTSGLNSELELRRETKVVFVSKFS